MTTPFVGGDVAPFGDAAVVAEVGDNRRVRALAAAVERGGPPGITEVVPGYTSLLLQVDPDHAVTCRHWLVEAVAHTTGGSAAPVAPVAPRTVDVPVHFDGEDLEAVAASVGLTVVDVVAMVCAAELEVAFLGFSPGFPYLTGLPAPLAALGRRASPRTAVPAGSVAVAGGFAAVYPQSTPGGWHLLGRTPVRLFDEERPPYALLRAGDRVRFRAAGHDVGQAHDAPVRPALDTDSARFVDVAEPGLLSMVQDEGRTRVAGVGVPAAGAADPDTFRLANRLVGNDDAAAAIEVTARGPELAFGCDAHVAVVAAGGEGGVELRLDGLGAPDGSVLPVRSGQVLSVGTVARGLRAYVGVAGGIDTGRIVGSRSSDRLCGLGPGPLRAGDRLALGEPGAPHGGVTADDGGTGGHVLRVIAGPHRFATGELARFVGRAWTVGRASDRVGVRLDGAPPVAPPAGGIASTGMVTGAVQVPPDGRPIVLLPDHATVGGYPVLCCVITADRGRLGRLGPGDEVAFELVTFDEAHALRLEHERRLARRITGWYPTAAGT